MFSHFKIQAGPSLEQLQLKGQVNRRLPINGLNE